MSNTPRWPLVTMATPQGTGRVTAPAPATSGCWLPSHQPHETLCWSRTGREGSRALPRSEMLTGVYLTCSQDTLDTQNIIINTGVTFPPPLQARIGSFSPN